MNKAITILTLGLQMALTFVVTFCIYVAFALLDSDFGIDGLFGLFIFQPILAILFSGLTIAICLIIGLPIRLNKKIKYWWTTNFYLPFLGIVFGIILLIVATLTREAISTNVDGQATLKQVPNVTLAMIGWFLTSFSLLHIYFPRKLVERIRMTFSLII